MTPVKDISMSATELPASPYHDRIRRENAVYRTSETWKPITFHTAGGGVQRAILILRRFFDLQFGSIYQDLARVLPHASGVLVDVGCGAQPFRPLVPTSVRYVGIDTADAREHFGYEVPDTIYYRGDRWPIEDGGADTVLCTETLEHVKRPQEFLVEAARCLRPGGALILTVPFEARWHYIPHDYWRYTPSGMSHLLTEAGFERIAVYPRGNLVTVACYKLMAVLLVMCFPQAGPAPVRILARLLGVLLSPLIVSLAAIANLSLTYGGDDCLGYTVLAVKAVWEKRATEDSI